jgi:hypothetical protein
VGATLRKADGKSHCQGKGSPRNEVHHPASRWTKLAALQLGFWKKWSTISRAAMISKQEEYCQAASKAIMLTKICYAEEKNYGSENRKKGSTAHTEGCTTKRWELLISINNVIILLYIGSNNVFPDDPIVLGRRLCLR